MGRLATCPHCNTTFELKTRASDAVDRSEDVRAVYAGYRSLHPKIPAEINSGSKEYQAIRARLEEGFTIADLCKAIAGMHRTPHNQGVNDRGQKYLGLGLCMRNRDQVIRFMEAADGPAPSPPSRNTSVTGLALKAREERRQQALGSGETKALPEAKR